MKKSIFIVLAFVALLTGCRSQEGTVSEEQRVSTAAGEWKQSEPVELTRTLWPSRGDAAFYIKGDDGRSDPHLRFMDLNKNNYLESGMRLAVKGIVQYVHYPRPKAYYNNKGGVNYAVVLPQTSCYINVSELKILTPQPESEGDRLKSAP